MKFSFWKISKGFGFVFILFGIIVHLIAIQPARAAAGPDCYVDISTAPGGTGDSWGAPYKYLQDALADTNCTIIHVAEGVYYPDEGTGQTADDRASTFQLKNGVKLYGGYPTSGGTRDWLANPTVLSGDIDQNDTTDTNGVITDTANITGDNAYHVVTGSGTNSTAVLDGFTITGGLADGTYASPCGPPCGGGMYNASGSPALTNISFSGNQTSAVGGGMYNHSSSPALTNVTFSGNIATYGGGMYSAYSDPALTNVTFSDNTAGYAGGGMGNDLSSPVLTNVTFSGNTAGYRGGAMDNYYSDPALTNVTFSGNTALYAGGIYNYFSDPALTNVTFSGNKSGYDGGGMLNLYSNPTLVNVTFSGNQATTAGGGMYNYDSSPLIQNSILWGNAASNGPQVYNDNSTPTFAYSLKEGEHYSAFGAMDAANSTPTFTYSLVEGCPADMTGCGTAGDSNLDGTLAANNPLFVAPVAATSAPTTAGDYRLRLGSPAIDAGNDTFNPTLTDLDGNPRLFGAAVDLGAYELQLYVIYLPLIFKVTP